MSQYDTSSQINLRREGPDFAYRVISLLRSNCAFEVRRTSTPDAISSGSAARKAEKRSHVRTTLQAAYTWGALQRMQQNRCAPDMSDSENHGAERSVEGCTTFQKI